MAVPNRSVRMKTNQVVRIRQLPCAIVSDGLTVMHVSPPIL